MRNPIAASPHQIVITQRALAARLRQLPAPIRAVVQQVGALGDRLGWAVYLVGGGVRDLLLGLPLVDVDVMVDGDGIECARRYAETFGGRLRIYAAFGTAQVQGTDSLLVDFATARTETYAAPGALPVVARGSIEQDLARRDFTINAMALCLNSATVGRLVDPYGGVTDLQQRTIRILHARSFEDDPTRLFRAVRFATRLRCSLSRDTRRLFEQALTAGVIARLSAHRLTRECRLLLSERDPANALRLARATGLFDAVHPALSNACAPRVLSPLAATIQWCRARACASTRPIDSRVVWLLALTVPMSAVALRSLLARCEFEQRVRRLILVTRRRQRVVCRVLSSASTLAPSRLVRVLSGFDAEAVVYLRASCKGVRARRRIDAYLTQYCEMVPLLDGNDLRRMGVPPGPLMARLLTRLREAQLDGVVRTREEAGLRVSRILRRAGR